MLPENLSKLLSTAFPLSATDISPNNLLTGLQTNTLLVFAVISIKLSVVLDGKRVGGRAEEFSIGRRFSMDNPGTTNSHKLWDKVCGEEFLPVLLHGRQRWEGRRIWVLWLLYLPQSSGSSMLLWGHTNLIFTKDKLLKHSSWSGTHAFSVSGKGNGKPETFLMQPKPDTPVKIWHLNVCVVKCYRRKGLLYTARLLHCAVYDMTLENSICASRA